MGVVVGWWKQKFRKIADQLPLMDSPERAKCFMRLQKLLMTVPAILATFGKPSPITILICYRIKTYVGRLDFADPCSSEHRRFI